MSEEKKQDDFKLSNYKFHALGISIFFPAILWLTTSTNPLTETYHFLIGVQSSKIAVISFLFVAFIIYYTIVLTLRKRLKPKEHKQVLKDTDLQEIKTKEQDKENVSSIFSPTKEYQKPPVIKWEKHELVKEQVKLLNQELAEDKTSILPKPHLQGFSKGDEKASPTEQNKDKQGIDGLANKLIATLSTTAKIEKGEKEVLTSLTKVISEKGIERIGIEKEVAKSEPLMLINEKGYTQQELAILSDNLENVVSKTQKKQLDIDFKTVPNLLAKKKI